MRRTIIGLVASGLAAAAWPAQAQPPPANPAGIVQGVTVTGESSQGLRTGLDRRSYGVANDLQATTGSISDALRNIPSIDVDPSGAISLRGSENVVIMIDGKRSGMLSGEGRARALQGMPADQIERVEVITNPSAEFQADGAVGVINLISRKIHKPGRTASVRANLGVRGSGSAGIAAAYNTAGLTLSTDAGVRRQATSIHALGLRKTPSPAGVPTVTLEDSRDVGVIDAANLRFGAEYDLDPRTRINGELTGATQAYKSSIFESTTGPLIYDRFAPDYRSVRTSSKASGGYRRTFAGDDHNIALSLAFERTRREGEWGSVVTYQVPADPLRFERFASRVYTRQLDLKLDYVRPMPGDAKLKTGYALQIDDNDYGDFVIRGPHAGSNAAASDANNNFLFEQTVQAVYATYERPFGDLTVLAGLRLEDVRLNGEQVAPKLTFTQGHFRAYPSLHLGYKLDDEHRLTASYSRRTQRPPPEQLNPFVTFRDEFIATAGNPRLKPQQTHSLEAG